MHAALSKLGFFFFFLDEMKTDKPTDYSYPAKLSSFQAKLGLSQLNRLEENLARRRSIALALEARIHRLGSRPLRDG